MKNQAKLLAVLTAAALSAGCASGGGGSGGGGGHVETRPIPAKPTPTAEIRCAWILPICGWFEPNSDTAIVAWFAAGLNGRRPARFASWSELAPRQPAEFDAISSVVTYEQASSGAISATSVTELADQRLLSTGPRYTAEMKLEGASVTPIGNGIDVAASRVGDVLELGVIANPYTQGWNYQSFGVWNSAGPGTREITASSFGAPTPASAVPSSGAASFVGKLGGMYVSPRGEGSVASADVRVDANFTSRSLSFASNGTRLTQDLKTSAAASQLNLSGTLTYSPTTNTFGGTLTNAGGTMSGSSAGRYYGPAAQELGGTFALKSPGSPETFVGAYGAKR